MISKNSNSLRAATMMGAIATMFAAAFAQAAAPMAKFQAPGFYRMALGDFEVTVLNDGTVDLPVDKQLRQPAAKTIQALDKSFVKAPLETSVNAFLINTGGKLVLIDTGTGGQFVSFAPQSGIWQSNLAAAGIDPRRVDSILISHGHPDHINGIKTKDNALAFPNAEIFIAAPEWAYWLDDANLAKAADTARPQFLNARRIFRDIGKRVTQFEGERELVPGITTVAAPGHTPGHYAFAIASGNQSLLVLSDVTNNPYLFARHPEWQAVIDVEGPRAVETRRQLLDRAAADRMLVQGYHFPFPAIGHIARAGGGYDFVPETWQAQP